MTYLPGKSAPDDQAALIHGRSAAAADECGPPAFRRSAGAAVRAERASDKGSVPRGARLVGSRAGFVSGLEYLPRHVCAEAAPGTDRLTQALVTGTRDYFYPKLCPCHDMGLAFIMQSNGKVGLAGLVVGSGLFVHGESLLG